MTKRLQFDTKDEPLRADVRDLGAVVGEVIAEQGSPDLFEQVEAVRRAAISRREGSGEDQTEDAATDELSSLVAGLDADRAHALVRAFSLYFRAVNLAEAIHRVRRRREYERDESSVQPGGVEDALRKIDESGVSASELEKALERLSVEAIFTAHPTEATRRSVLEKERRIAMRLAERFHPRLTPYELDVNRARVRSEIAAIWQTEEQPPTRPTVLDEVDHVLYYLIEVIYRVVPVFGETLDRALQRTYGGEREAPQTLGFGSWVGGDMDGNPNVDAETLASALVRQRAALLARYRSEVRGLARRLSQTTPRVEVDREVLDRVARYVEELPDAAARISPRHANMPYRRLLELVAAKLDHTIEDRRTGYASDAEFRSDLETIVASLDRHRGRHAGAFAVRRLIRRVRTFGFHLAAIDVRQDGRLHREVVGRILGEPKWGEWSSADRWRRVAEELEAGGERELPVDPEVDRTMGVFRAIRRCRERFGPGSVGPYIVSMAQGGDDVLSVLLLARWAGLVDGEGGVPLDVAPLFETVPDLEAAPAVVRELFVDPIYREHLEARRRRQMIMIGYSDSSKDGGLIASRWSLQRAQEALAKEHETAGVELTIFHGRGGTISRGGGKTHRAVLASPRGAVNGRLRITEQGESIHAKYGIRGIALRNLERSTSALLRAELLPAGDDSRASLWNEILDGMAKVGRQVFRGLVYEHPDFLEYFHLATPIDVITQLEIGSRPASRGRGGSIDSLRAIPWVFSWTQNRHVMTGWFGVGSALESAMERHSFDTLREATTECPFLKVVLEDVEMVLAKADFRIARRYAALAENVGERIFPILEKEYQRTVELVLALAGEKQLLDRDPTLQRSILLRNPYVDPMSEIQVDLLRRWREGGREDDELKRALFATVRGIAQGLQNTG